MQIGGYDKRVTENFAYHNELRELAVSLNLKSETAKDLDVVLSPDIDILFLLSVTDEVKARLLEATSLLVYTPKFEHFGIVPLEAMLAGTPVLAANLGGPTETVVEDQTGWLRDADEPSQWTEIMQRVLQEMNERELTLMGQNGRKRVVDQFSKETMAQRLDQEIEGMLRRKSRPDPWSQVLLGILAMVVLVGGVVNFARGPGVESQQ